MLEEGNDALKRVGHVQGKEGEHRKQYIPDAVPRKDAPKMKDVSQEFDKAIAAHGQWKTRLKQAIESSTIDVPVATIAMNNQCAFGKWLYSPTLTPEDKTTPHYKTVTELHTQFHKAAAKIAALAVAGKKADAKQLLEINGDFATISGQLTGALMVWKKSFVPVP
jgi:hypothetical protein